MSSMSKLSAPISLFWSPVADRCSSAWHCSFSGSPADEDRLSNDAYVIDRTDYADAAEGSGYQSIANWTGLSTEMVKVAPPFFTDADWGKWVEPAIWGRFVPHTGRMDFFLPDADKVWGSDDDTDIEYMYQHLLEKTTGLFCQVQSYERAGCAIFMMTKMRPCRAIISSRKTTSGFQISAHDLMVQGMEPPQTSAPENNRLSDMIDAQLTTEVFGLFAPSRPDIALRMAHLPVRVSAHGMAAHIAEFYIVMHALAAIAPREMSLKDKTRWLATQARTTLPEGSTAAAMFDFIWTQCHATADRDDWEQVRDMIYRRYQKTSHDGYIYKQGFDAGINFAASLVSLYFGEGDIKRTIRIGNLGFDNNRSWGG